MTLRVSVEARARLIAPISEQLVDKLGSIHSYLHFGYDFIRIALIFQRSPEKHGRAQRAESRRSRPRAVVSAVN